MLKTHKWLAYSACPSASRTDYMRAGYFLWLVSVYMSTEWDYL